MRLQQIIANLLGNAAKYTPRDGKVTLTLTSEEGDAVIRVRDTGPGLPKNMLDSVFDLFVQAGHTLDRAGGGIGVGLTLVRSLVTMHAGTVTAHSEGEGKGCEFVVRLPLSTARVDDGAARRNRPLRSGVRLPPGAQRSSSVEDNPDKSRDALQRSRRPRQATECPTCLAVIRLLTRPHPRARWTSGCYAITRHRAAGSWMVRKLRASFAKIPRHRRHVGSLRAPVGYGSRPSDRRRSRGLRGLHVTSRKKPGPGGPYSGALLQRCRSMDP